MAERYRLILLWAVLAGGIAVALSSGVVRTQKIVANEAIAQGVVIKKTCENHQSISYAYAYDQKQIVATNGSPIRCELLREGQTLKVWLSRVDPSISSLIEPRAKLNDDMWFLILAASILPTFVVLCVAGRSKIVRAWRWR